MRFEMFFILELKQALSGQREWWGV